ncbi:lysozyme [uncultured Shewanella sp.]|uniref:glycoside hydrolase family protein n=1 Tax=uncultured Shewanella sp. TaxID=173975 RepID=UPI0026268F26|nr:lysozyme [uncultured Shewanella sp.]
MHYDEQRYAQQSPYTPTIPSLINVACEFIAAEEGFRDTPYHCSEGYPTIGYGQRIGKKNQSLTNFKFTLPEPAARAWLKHGIIQRLNELDSYSSLAAVFMEQNIPRQVVLLSMAYQLGVKGLSLFKNMLASLSIGDYVMAAEHALDSRWAKQTPERAQHHAHILQTGKLDGTGGVMDGQKN